MHKFFQVRRKSINRNSNFIVPQIRVHYVHSVTIRRRNRVRWQTAAPVMLALVLGVSVGSVVVWQSKYGEANRAAEDAPLVETAIDQSWSKPLTNDPAELNVVADILPILAEENRHEPSAEEIANAQRKEKLRRFLASYKSPFAKNDETLQAFLDAKNMKLMLAISFVESTLGKKCYYNNCSGIGGYPPNLKKYGTTADWVRDFDNVLEKHYKGLPVEKFMGLYVQPGSPNWIAGVKQILADLKKQGIE